MNISQLFYPTEKIVGIEISKQYIKAILLEKTKDKVLMRKKSYVDLPSGLILDHQIKDKKAFVEILNKFRQDNKEILRSKNVILSIPSNFVFTYLSSFPVLDYENLNKAVNLSLATDMFFPDDVENVYYDWEEIPKEIPDKSEVFISFSKKENIDDYISAFSEAGFDLVAVEFGARSLARALSIFGDSVGLAVNILSDGINFSVIFKNKLLFSNFYKIPEIRSQEEFNALVKRKLSEVVNFYNTDQNSFGKIQNVSVVFPYEEKKALVEFLQKETGLNFLDPAVDGSMLKETASSIDDFWISIFGTALRGLLPRESDRDISLMTVGTEESFKKRKLMSYMFLWGDISSVVVIFFSLLFAGSLFFMNMLLTDTKVKFSQLQVGSTARSETETLIAESEKFNTLVSRTLEIQTNKFELKKIMEDVSAVLPQESIKPLSFEMASPDGMIILRVIAKDSKAAFELRDNLKNSGKFYDIKMPVLGIDQRSNIAITISFKIL